MYKLNVDHNPEISFSLSLIKYLFSFSKVFFSLCPEFKCPAQLYSGLVLAATAKPRMKIAFIPQRHLHFAPIIEVDLINAPEIIQYSLRKKYTFSLVIQLHSLVLFCKDRNYCMPFFKWRN